METKSPSLKFNSGKLPASIGLVQGLALAFSLVIGSGLLGLPGLTLKSWGAHNALVAWLLTIIAVFPLVHVFSKLGARFPSAGGLATYCEVVAGKPGAYAMTFLVLGSVVLGVPAVGVICASYAQRLLGFSPSGISWVAMAIFWLVTLLNLRGVRPSGWLNQFSMISILIVIFVLIGIAPHHLGAGFRILEDVVAHPMQLEVTSVRGCGLVLFWAFIGWEELSFALEEFHNSRVNGPLVYILSYVMVSILYLFLAVLSAGAFVHGVRITGPSGLAALLRGSGWSTLVLFMMVLVGVANTNSNVYAYSRLAFSAGRDGIFPRVFSRLSSRRVPGASLVIMSTTYTLVILGMELTGGSWTTIISMVDQNFLLLYLVAILAYCKTESGKMKWLVGGASLCSCGFLLSVEWRPLMYSIILVSVGLLWFLIVSKTRSVISRAEN